MADIKAEIDKINSDLQNIFSDIYQNDFDISDDGKKYTAVASISRPNEEFITREIYMTMAGFLYKALDGWRPAKKIREIKMNNWKHFYDGLADNEENFKPFRLQDLESIYNSLGAHLERVRTAHNNLIHDEEIKHLKREELLENISGEEVEKKIEEQRTAQEIYNTKIALVTQYLFNIGRDADLRTSATEKLPLLEEYRVNTRRVDHTSILLPQEIIKEFAKQFLDQNFEYNPDIHACELGPDKEKYTLPERRFKDTMQQSIRMENEKVKLDDGTELILRNTDQFKLMTQAPESIGLIAHILNTPSLANAMGAMIYWRDKTGPVFARLADLYGELDKTYPADFLIKFNEYRRAMFDRYRFLTKLKFGYGHLAIIPTAVVKLFKVFAGDSQEELDKKYKEYTMEYGESHTFPLMQLNAGAWHVLDELSELQTTTETRQENDQNLVKLMIEDHAAQTRLASIISKNQTRRQKAQTIEEEGPDDEGAEDQMAVGNMSSMLDKQERRNLNKAKGNLRLANKYDESDLIKREQEDLRQKIIARTATLAEVDRFDEIKEKLKELKRVIDLEENEKTVNFYKMEGKVLKKKEVYYKDAM